MRTPTLTFLTMLTAVAMAAEGEGGAVSVSSGTPTPLRFVAGVTGSVLAFITLGIFYSFNLSRRVSNISE